MEATPEQVDVVTAVALAMHRIITARARHIGAGLQSPDRKDWVVVVGQTRRAARLSVVGGDLAIELTDEARTLNLTAIDWRPGASLFRARLDDRAFTVSVSPADEGFVIRLRAAVLKVMVLTPVSADLHARLPAKTPPDTSRLVVSPMPGLVITADVAQGEDVKEGQVLFVIEAMKMQNILRAERDGILKVVSVKAGDSVAADDILAEFG